MRSRVVFSSQNVKWQTPIDLYDALEREFHFTLDPCPLGWMESRDLSGLSGSWSGERVYCNPPYGRGIGNWLAKASEAEVAVFLLPSRTDTQWFHDFCLGADEIRFLRGRLKFGNAKNGAPFPSMVVVFRKKETR